MSLFFGEKVRLGEALPVIIKNKDGSVNEKETARINANNRLFKIAQENNTFTMGKLVNAITKLKSRQSTGEAASVIHAAEKTSDFDKARAAKAEALKAQKKHGGSVKKYARGGGVRQARYK